MKKVVHLNMSPCKLENIELTKQMNAQKYVFSIKTFSLTWYTIPYDRKTWTGKVLQFNFLSTQMNFPKLSEREENSKIISHFSHLFQN
jgi:hypothetical protein